MGFVSCSGLFFVNCIDTREKEEMDSMAGPTDRDIMGNSENLEIMLDFRETRLEGFSEHQVSAG